MFSIWGVAYIYATLDAQNIRKISNVFSEKIGQNIRKISNVFDLGCGIYIYICHTPDLRSASAGQDVQQIAKIPALVWIWSCIRYLYQSEIGKDTPVQFYLQDLQYFLTAKSSVKSDLC